MSKLIKLTNETGKLLADRAAADGVTMAEEIKRLLIGDKSREILDRLDRMEKLLKINKKSKAVTGHASASGSSPTPGPEPETEPERAEDEHAELTYGEVIQRMEAVNKELQAGVSDERRKELENKLRGLYVDLATAESE